MHSDLKVVKEAWQQINKADSWVSAALRTEGMDEELLERWNSIFEDIQEALISFQKDS